MACDADAARTFIQGNARILEQHLYTVLFEAGDPDLVVTALLAFTNPDGGFGHGLEPDKRASASQPLDVEVAFERLVSAGSSGPGVEELAVRACRWLASLAGPTGLVPILLPTVADGPRAEHWQAVEYPPAINPTAAIVAHGLAMGLSHPWLRQASEACLLEVESGAPPTSGPGLLALTKLVDVVADRDRVELVAKRIQVALPTASFVKLEPLADAYGVTPLEFAPSPEATARDWFDDRLIEAHLDELEAQQQPDGGWSLSWKPPTPGATCDWRGIRTVEALRVLRAYGRLG